MQCFGIDKYFDWERVFFFKQLFQFVGQEGLGVRGPKIWERVTMLVIVFIRF